MRTVTQLAKHFGLSRTTILYYEREGLLKPSLRAQNGYRYYGEQEQTVLEQIVSYRALGLPIAEIKQLLKNDKHSDHQSLLRQQFDSLEREVQKLRTQQQAIVAMLQDPNLLKTEQLDKERWTALLRASGMTDKDMENWHIQFERLEPEGHEAFLVSLGINEEERASIRDWSKQ